MRLTAFYNGAYYEKQHFFIYGFSCVRTAADFASAARRELK